MAIPTGTYIVKSAAFPDRVADLANARMLDALIGFHESRAPNQRWTFLNLRNNEFQVSTTATSSAGLSAFVRATAIEEGAFVTGGGLRDRNLYTVAELPGNRFRISPRENPEIAWTLPSGREGERLILHDIDGNLNQAWEFIRI